MRWYIDVGMKDVNQEDKNGCTALFYAIQKNHVVIVKDLIKAGAGENNFWVFSFSLRFYFI